MNRFIKWHNSQIDWWKKKLNVSWYAVSWISFIKGALLVLIIVALTGCSIGGEKKIKIFSVEQPREKLNFPMPTPLQMEEIYWHIITSENAEEVFKKLRGEKGTMVNVHILREEMEPFEVTLIREKPNEKFIAGGEESYGYLVDDFVRDKDAVISSAIICEIANWCKNKNEDLTDFLNFIYKKYGFYFEKLHTIKLDGVKGKKKINVVANAMIV